VVAAVGVALAVLTTAFNVVLGRNLSHDADWSPSPSRAGASRCRRA